VLYILGKEVRIAFALQVLYVGVYKWHYKQTTLLNEGRGGGFDIMLSKKGHYHG